MITKIKTKSKISENININTEISYGALLSIISFGSIIGCWSMACIVSAMVTIGGGPIALLYAWINAITG